MDTDVNTLSIDLGTQRYDIIIGRHILKQNGHYFDHLFPIPKAIIITDEHVATHYLRMVQSALTAQGVAVDTVILPAGEESKSFETLEWVLNQLFEYKPERKTTLIALGGGVVGDLTGFVASILLRGVPFIQIPTTLLAQVDSSVGGKTGINTLFGKNLVGSFYQPKRVLIDIALLQSLPMRQFLAGFAEVIKYALIQDSDFYQWLQVNKDSILNKEPDSLQYMIAKSCEIKAYIVAQDEKEQGVRALLNLGHTFGHALEAFAGYSDILLHGEGVALGMGMAVNLSVKLGFCDQSVYEDVIEFMQEVGLPVSLSEIDVNWDIQELLNLMYQDKKVSEGKMVFILLKSIGEGITQNDIDSSLILQVLQEAL